MSQLPIHAEVLPNGLTALLCETHLAPVAEFQVWARVGAADERDGERGLAHFHEHMLFKGTERRGVGEIAGEIEGAGGRINAYTTYDVTVYHATLPSDRIDVGIDVLADAITSSVFEPDEIRREIDVVLEEIRRGKDAPAHVLGDAIFAEAYRVHPYRAPILGSLESVSSFDRERVQGFYRRWYTPENLVVVAAGDFDREALLARVRERFGALAPGRAKRARPPEPEQRGLRCQILKTPFERAHVELAWPSVGLSNSDGPHLDLLAYVLGGCESSRLVQRVKEQRACVERIDAYSYTPLDPGLSTVDFETDPERVLAAIEATVCEVERLRTQPVLEEELERARANFLAMEHFERESVAGIASKIGSFHVTGGDYALEQRYLDAVRQATPADLQDVARRYLAPEQITAGAVLPESGAAGVDVAGVEAAVTRAVERTRRSLAPPGRTAASPSLTSYTLDCGAQLHVVARRDVPVVAARAAFLGGLLAESPESSGVTAFLTSMWLRGTAGHSAAGFARAVENRAAEIDAFCGRSSFGLTLEAPSAELAPALDLFSEVLLEPALEADEIERERRETLAAIERREDRLAQLAFLGFAEQQFQRHPYRMPTLGTAPVVEALSREALAQHQQRFVRGHNCAIAVAGDVDPDTVAAMLSARLADFEAGGFEWTAPPEEEAPREIRRAELRKDRAQAHLVIGFRGVTVADPDRYALEVLAQLLAGQGGRLFLELRDKQGLAYAVNAVSVEGLAPGYFALYIATSPERLDEARAGLLSEIDGVLQSPPGEDELDRARRHLAGNFVIDQQRNAVHAAHASLYARYGLGPEAARSYPEDVLAVTREDVLRAARRILDLTAYTESLVRP